MNALPRRVRLALAVLIGLVALYDLFLLSNGTFRLFAPEYLGHAYDSMLRHLLHGEFTVDREAIGSEAFTRDGRTYAYFGLFPAALRLLAMPFAEIGRAELARLSCLAAIVAYVALQLRALLLVHERLPQTARNPILLAVMVVATVLGGPQLYLLGSAWIFHESIFWASAMGAAFNLVVLQAALDGRPLRPGESLLLALLAGLALHTRPSVGVALAVAAGLLLGWTALTRHALAATGRSLAARAGGLLAAVPRAACDPRLLLPVALLALFAAGAGLVNWERWGNPLSFADFRYYDFAHRQPHRLEVVRTYGELNPGRIPVAALYYATGLPYVVKGMAPFAGYLRAHFDGLEAPPLTGLLTNPLTVLLAGAGLWTLLRRRPDLPAGAAALLRLTLAGHAVAIVLLLSAMYLALRYRLDFAPFMTLAALVGYRTVSLAAASWPERRHRRLLAGAVALCALGVVSSHYVLIVHKVWSQGVPMEVRRALLPLAPFAHAAFEP